MVKNLSEEIQQGLLLLLIHDPIKYVVIREVMEEKYFIKPYDSLAKLAFKFIDAYNSCPSVHIYELINNEISNEDLKQELVGISDILGSIWEKKQHNADYIMSQLDKFVRRAGWVSTLEESLTYLQKGEIEKIEEIVDKQIKKRVALFDPGSRIDSEFLDYLLTPENKEWEFQFGIPSFDEKELGFLRGELVMLTQPSKTGKTMGLIHMAKTNILKQNKKICHINLEVAHSEIRKRYVQSFFELTKHKMERVIVSLFERDVEDRFVGINRDIFSTGYLSDPEEIEGIRNDKIMGLLHDNLIIRTFPSGSLTVGMLRVYLENLIEREKYYPDIVIVDYPDIMKIEDKRGKDYLNLDQLFIDLRGVAGEYNIGMLVASQTNKEGTKANKSDGTHAAGSYGKIANADVNLSYSQKQREKELGLARLSISEARRIESGLTAIISQSYHLSQYCLDSILMENNYFDVVNSVVDF